MRASTVSLIQHFETEVNSGLPVEFNRKQCCCIYKTYLIATSISIALLLVSCFIKHGTTDKFNTQRDRNLKWLRDLSHIHNTTHAIKKSNDMNYILNVSLAKELAVVDTSIINKIEETEKIKTWNKAVKNEISTLSGKENEIKSEISNWYVIIGEWEHANSDERNWKEYIQEWDLNYKRLLAEHNALWTIQEQCSNSNETIITQILHSDIIRDYPEYKMWISWIENTRHVIDNPGEKAWNKTWWMQKIKINDDTPEQLMKWTNKEKEIIVARRNILILLKLETGERFGVCILNEQNSIWKWEWNDNNSFFFSFDKNKKYTMIPCWKNMETFYIISFKRGMEIYIPKACFENDDLFSVEERLKFYKTKKHFNVKQIELYYVTYE